MRPQGDGAGEGCFVGFEDGLKVGRKVGAGEGCFVGLEDGLKVGRKVGETVGERYKGQLAVEPSRVDACMRKTKACLPGAPLAWFALDPTTTPTSASTEIAKPCTREFEEDARSVILLASLQVMDEEDVHP